MCQQRGLEATDRSNMIQRLMNERVTINDLDVAGLKSNLKRDGNYEERSGLVWDELIVRVSPSVGQWQLPSSSSSPPVDPEQVQCTKVYLSMLANKKLVKICKRRGLKRYSRYDKTKLVQLMWDAKIVYGDLLDDELDIILHSDWRTREKDEGNDAFEDDPWPTMTSRTRLVQYLSTTSLFISNSHPASASTPPNQSQRYGLFLLVASY